MLAALPHLSRDTTSGKDGDYHTWEHRVDLLIAAVEVRCRDQELLPARIPVCLTTTESMSAWREQMSPRAGTKDTSHFARWRDGGKCWASDISI